MYLSQEEEEIIHRYRQLAQWEKEAVLASERSFWDWIKSAVRWVWERIVDVVTSEIVREVFFVLRKALFGI